jgi:hypothetical protein
MSELTNAPAERKDFHIHLLTSVCAFALLASIYGTSRADAADGDTDRALLWIELGGQLEAIAGQGDPFTAPFMATNADSPAFKPLSPLEMEKSPRYGIGADAKISFEPEDTNWVFSAGVRYGRANANRQIHQQTPGIQFPATSIVYQYYTHTHPIKNFIETSAKLEESHIVVDFQAGKDIGLGMFGSGSRSVVSLGVRFAQFTSDSTINMRARPAASLPPNYHKYFNTYALAGHSARSFHGIGPSLSWNASAPVAGNSQDGRVTLDWGVNAAVLFGRQKADVQHQTVGRAFGVPKYYTTLYQHTGGHDKARSVVVPNVGGFAGASYRFSNAALSFGYRGDFFLNAVDAGIDARRRNNLSFSGPFASLSIGIGG